MCIRDSNDIRLILDGEDISNLDSVEESEEDVELFCNPGETDDETSEDDMLKVEAANDELCQIGEELDECLELQDLLCDILNDNLLGDYVSKWGINKVCREVRRTTSLKVLRKRTNKELNLEYEMNILKAEICRLEGCEYSLKLSLIHISEPTRPY